MTRLRPAMDPRLLRDEWFARLDPAAQRLWYHLAFACPHLGLSLDEICRALVVLGDPDLLAHLRRYAMGLHAAEEGTSWPSGEQLPRRGRTHRLR